MSTDDVSVPRESPEGLARAEVSAAPLRRVYDADAFWGQVSSQARTGQLGSICIAILLHRWYSPPPSPSDLLRRLLLHQITDGAMYLWIRGQFFPHRLHIVVARSLVG